MAGEDNGQSDGSPFDYEDDKRIEGRGSLGVEARDLAALRLERCLEAISGQSGRVLEIGCGAGRHCRALRKYRPDLSVFGCDISETALREARAEGGGVAYDRGDATNLPYPNDYFDAVVLFDVLEHVDDVRKAVSEIYRILRDGGVFHGFIPCEGNPGTIFSVLGRRGWLPIYRWKREYVGHIQRLTSGGVSRLFEKQGFAILHTSFSFHLAAQVLDIFDFWHRSVAATHSPASWCPRFTRILSRLVFIPTWRLAYYEDRLLQNHPAATGFHLTCIKRS